MVKDLPKNQLQRIVDFVVDNYDTAPEYLYPKTVEELLDRDGKSDVVIMEDAHGIEALCFVSRKYPHVAEVYRSVVRMDCRGLGISKKLDEMTENMLRNMGVKKIQTYVYTNNYPSVFRRLKRGFLVEGLTRNNDGKGMSTYTMGKEL